LGRVAADKNNNLKLGEEITNRLIFDASNYPLASARGGI